MRPPAPTLDYGSADPAVAARWPWRIAIAAAATPLAFVACVHAIYAVEYLANGSRPTPAQHGGDSPVEAALYGTSFLLAVGCVPAFVVHILALALIFSPRVGRRRSAPLGVATAMLLAWPVAAAIVWLDPARAFWFWLD